MLNELTELQREVLLTQFCRISLLVSLFSSIVALFSDRGSKLVVFNWIPLIASHLGDTCS